jgi:hypothetical protein
MRAAWSEQNRFSCIVKAEVALAEAGYCTTRSFVTGTWNPTYILSTWNLSENFSGNVKAKDSE